MRLFFRFVTQKSNHWIEVVFTLISDKIVVISNIALDACNFRHLQRQHINIVCFMQISNKKYFGDILFAHR